MDEVAFSLELAARREDRVVVNVRVGAASGPSTVEAVALELRSRDGRPLGPRMSLPISGALHGSICSTVELRSLEPLPVGAIVTGLLWTQGGAPVEVVCPADLWTDLGDHVRGRLARFPDLRDVELDDVGGEDRAVLVARWPWVGQDMFPPEVSGILEQREGDDDALDADALADEFGLDAEGAEALRDILTDG